MADRPTIVCLCGSTRFSKQFREANLRETLAGKIVLTVGCDTKSDDMLGLDQGVKQMLDELHLRKIDLADEVLILDVAYPTCPRCGLIREASSHNICMVERFELRPYIGSSTRRELEYARSLGKRIRFLSEER